MSVKPILFSAEMVRAILDGRKTVTRRVVKPQPNGTLDQRWGGFYEDNEWILLKEPYRPGDVLWVRETWAENPHPWDGAKYVYRANIHPADYDLYKWRPSIHMPKEAARIWLRVTDVRAERLQGITPEDVCNEGQWPYEWSEWTGKDVLFPDWREDFAELWDGTIKRADRDRYGWAANPWVFRVEFERCEKPEEA